VPSSFNHYFASVSTSLSVSNLWPPRSYHFSLYCQCNIWEIKTHKP
jgi:hypothetical protein